jgi:hypothetical protein
MNAIKAIVKLGRVELDAPPDWPDGTEVLIEPSAGTSESFGIDESEWRDDPASLSDWDVWIKTIEPLEFTPEEVQKRAEFAEKMRLHNLSAVRRQMELGTSG